MGTTNFQQPAGQGYTTGNGGIDIQSILDGLATPYRSYDYSDPRGYTNDPTADPDALFAKARQAQLQAQVPIPSWEDVYNTAAQMRQDRLTQELNSIRGTGDAALAQITALLGRPLPQMPGGPLGEEFGQLYQLAGDFAKAEVPVQVMGAQNKARTASSAALDQIMANLASTGYQGQVQQALNTPNQIMSAFGSYTDLAGQRAQNARAELQAIVQQEIDDRKAQSDAIGKRYDAGVDLTKQGIIQGGQWDIAALGQQGQNDRAQLSSDTDIAKAKLSSDTDIAKANLAAQTTLARQGAADDAAMQRLNAKSTLDANSPLTKARINDYTAQAAKARAAVKNGKPLTAAEVKRSQEVGAQLASIEQSFSGFSPTAVDTGKKPTNDDLGNVDNIILSMAAATLQGGPKAGAAYDYFDRLAKQWGSQNTDRKLTAADREKAIRIKAQEYKSQYNMLTGRTNNGIPKFNKDDMRQLLDILGWSTAQSQYSSMPTMAVRQ